MNEETNNYCKKFAYDTINDRIYICNTEGIYCADTSDKNSTFSLVVPAEKCTPLWADYWIFDLCAASKDKLYLLSSEGLDPGYLDYPTAMTMYQKK